ncbi:MAG: hypothetical protein R6U26_04300 [Candidatus Undinarchaeales archaeon]
MSNFENKTIKVKITGDALEYFERLEKNVNKEIEKGISSSELQTLYDAIKEKINFLKKNPEYGVHIKKKLIPKKYINLYDVNNLWKVNLPGAQRMIYTIKGSEIEIIALILDIFSHKNYEKTFGYKRG